jgi:hypothetical protein
MSLDLARWMWNFLLAMNEKKMKESIAVLADLSLYSLEFYKQIDFNMDNFNDQYRVYRDARDLGYVLSYNSRDSCIKDSCRSFELLEYISTFAIPIIAQELNINIPLLNGSD